jgi:hypothetical protein
MNRQAIDTAAFHRKSHAVGGAWGHRPKAVGRSAAAPPG